jgi:chromosome segregation ATPase
MKIENIKEEVTYDMENLRKNNQTETQNTAAGHSSRLEQVEDRISELKDKIQIKEKTEELLVKQLNICERSIQELTNSIKRPKLRIMGIEEGKEVQAKGIHNIFNKIITENFPNLGKALPIQVQEASRTPNRFDQSRTSQRRIIIKTTNTLKAVREKKQITER